MCVMAFLTLPTPASTLRALSPVAQSVEQVTVNHWVGGSSPSRGASFQARIFDILR